MKGSGYITAQCCGNSEIELGAVYAAEMGIFEVSEANRSVHVLELKAYDRMLRFDRAFNGFETIGTAYGMMALCSTACGVELAQTQAEIETLPNG